MVQFRKHSRGSAAHVRHTVRKWNDLFAGLAMTCAVLCLSGTTATAISIDVIRNFKVLVSEQSARFRLECPLLLPPPIYCAHRGRQHLRCCSKGGFQSSAELTSTKENFTSLASGHSTAFGPIGGGTGGGGGGGAPSAQIAQSVSTELSSPIQPVPGPVVGQGAGGILLLAIGVFYGIRRSRSSKATAGNDQGFDGTRFGH